MKLIPQTTAGSRKDSRARKTEVRTTISTATAINLCSLELTFVEYVSRKTSKTFEGFS